MVRESTRNIPIALTTVPHDTIMNGKALCMRPTYQTLYIGAANPENPLGGAELSFLQLLKFGEAESKRCTVVTTGRGEFSEACEKYGVQIITVPMKEPIPVEQRNPFTLAAYISNLLLYSLRLARIVINEQCDLICSINRGGHPFAALAGLITRRSVVMHIRDIPQSKFASLMYRILISLFAKKAIIFSETVRSSLAMSTDKLLKLPMGVDLTLFQPRRKTKARN